MANESLITRRALMVAAPAVALAGPAAAQGPMLNIGRPDETPVAALFREWRDYYAWLNGPATRGIDNEDFDKLSDRLIDMEDRIIRTPAKGAQDVLMQVIAYTGYGDGGLPDLAAAPDFWAEARALVAA